MHLKDTQLVSTRDIDRHNHCKPSALLGMLQEVATTAANELSATRGLIKQRYNAFWMLARIMFRLDRPLLWQEELTVHTWHRVPHRVGLYRDFDLYVGDTLVGEAVSLWVLADVDTHKLVKTTELTEFWDTDGGELVKQTNLSRIAQPTEWSAAGTRSFYYSDADINGHVNNTRYADCICDAAHLERRTADSFVSGMQINFLGECMPGDTISLLMGQSRGLHCFRGVGQDGTARFDGTITLGGAATNT